MTIAQAFNEITAAQGGTPNYSGTIAAAIDALNDALAGSDQPAAQTIEGAVRLLGQHIGGGSSVTVESLTATENKTYTAPEGKAYSPVTVNVAAQEYAISCTVDGEASQSFVYKAVWDAGTSAYIKDPDSPALDKAAVGDILYVDAPEERVTDINDANGYLFAVAQPSSSAIYMPSSAITVNACED